MGWETREKCKFNPAPGCEDTTKCGTCGWNPEVARRRIWALKEAEAKKQKPIMTYFQKITASKEALAEFLASIKVLDGPWDDLFHAKFCTKCRASSCDGCPHEDKRRNPAWFLDQRVVGDGNDPLR